MYRSILNIIIIISIPAVFFFGLRWFECFCTDDTRQARQPSRCHGSGGTRRHGDGSRCRPPGAYLWIQNESQRRTQEVRENEGGRIKREKGKFILFLHVPIAKLLVIKIESHASNSSSSSSAFFNRLHILYAIISRAIFTLFSNYNPLPYTGLLYLSCDIVTS